LFVSALLLLSVAISVEQDNVGAVNAATIVSVTTTKPNGTYKVGDQMWINLNFSEPVTLGGAVSILLETGPSDRYAYCDISGTMQVVSCSYTVQVGDRSNDLDVQSKWAFVPGSSVTANGVDANVLLPVPGEAGSLSANSNLVIDGAGVDEQWQVPPKNQYGIHYGLIAEDYRENTSYLRYPTPSGNQSEYCSSVEKCADQNLEFRAVLPRCVQPTDTDCIEAVLAESSGKPEVTGEFSDVFPKVGTQEFVGSVGSKIPDGKTSTLYRFQDLPHSQLEGKSIDSYLVTVSVSGRNQKSVPSQRSLFASISPVSIIETDCDQRYGGCLDTAIGNANHDERAGIRCIAMDGFDTNKDGKINALDPTTGDKSFCALRRPFPAGTRFTVKVRVSVAPSGWLHGRLADPKITYNSDKKTSTQIVLSGEPVKVPVFAGFATYGGLDTELQAYYDSLCTAETNCLSPGGDGVNQTVSTPKDKRMMGVQPSYYSTRAFDVLAKWKNFTQDTSPALPSYWNIRTLSSDEMVSASPCITKASGVTGIVSTNATAYSSGPPSFDATTKNLQYEVSAPHYTQDGKTEFKGAYNLVIRDDVAECLYNFSSAFAAPAPPEEFDADGTSDVYVEEEPYVDEAIYGEEYPDVEEEFVDTSDGSYEMYEAAEFEEVSLAEYVAEEKDFTLTEDKDASGAVIDETEVFEETVVASIDAAVLTELQKSATANTAIDLSDGWFKFSATNFTFSKPTLKVQFGATPSKVVACVSGANIKLVKAIKAKCPAGTTLAKTIYCMKKKVAEAVVGAKPKCPKKTVLAQSVKCAKGATAVLVVAVSPKCAKGYSKVNTYFCVKDKIARKVSSVRVKCSNGFAVAKQLVCAKGKKFVTLTAAKPKCPKGYKPKKVIK
jgi:hypothetical protein